jgi:hypothetical protein
MPLDGREARLMDSATELRLGLHRSGYSPLPIMGKAPPLKNWQDKLESSPAEIEIWGKTFAYAESTGILTARTPAFDIDIRNPDAAQAVEDLMRERLESREGELLIRFGKRPKRAILFQTDRPFGKIQVTLNAPDGSTDQKLEFLGNGQQVVIFGIHPDTKAPYSWHGGREPGAIPRDALPYISEDEARELVNAAAQLLITDYGYKPKGDSASSGKDPRPPGAGDGHPREWLEDIENIAAGRELHDSIASLAMKLLKSGMSDGAAVNFIRAQMAASPVPRNDRWQERFDDIPRAVSTAREELAGQAPRGQAEPPWAPPQPPRPYTFPNPAAIPPRQFLYSKHYLRSSVSATIAAGGKAKTTLKLIEAIGMAVGRNLMTGEDLRAGPLRVWFVNAEEDQDELDRRAAAICQRYNIKPSECSDRLFITSLKGQPTPWHIATMVRNVPTLNRPLIDWLIAEIRAKAIDVLMIDPLVSFHRVSESANEHMDIVIKEGLGAISAATGASIALAHHTGKPKLGQLDAATVEDSRGASAIIWATRLNRVLNGMTAKDATALGIADADRWRYIRISGGKTNPAPPEKATWVKLESENLPNGDDVAVVIPWAPPDPFAAAASDVAYKVRELAKAGEYRADSRSPQWIGFAVASLLGLTLAYGADNKVEDITKAKRAIKTWIGSKTLATEKRSDEKRRQRIFIVPGPWTEPVSATATAPDFDDNELG